MFYDSSDEEINMFESFYSLSKDSLTKIKTNKEYENNEQNSISELSYIKLFNYYKSFFKINIEGMFYNCSLLKYLPEFECKYPLIIDMSRLFYGCKNLKSLPDISGWNTSEVENMDEIFFGCSIVYNLYLISQNGKLKMYIV